MKSMLGMAEIRDAPTYSEAMSRGRPDGTYEVAGT